MKNNFEQLIKNSLENHEVTYEAGAWEKFNKAQPPTPLYKSKWFVGGAALIAIIAAVTLYNVEFNSTKTQVNLVNNPVTEVNKPIQLEKKTKTIQVKKTELEESKAEESITTESTINLNIEQEKSKSKVSLGKTEDKIKVEDKTNTDDKTLANLGDDKNGALKIPLGTEPKPIKPKVDLTTPSASFYLEKTICKGNNINLIADEANENYDYSWKLNDGEIISGKVVALEANLIGINKVTLFIKQGGLQIAEKKSTFTVLETPTGNVKIKLNQVALINELEFDMEYAYNQIVWSFGDGIKSTESSSTHTYKK
ncbi:MAG: hypothetical protein QMC34_00780, partial [Flavobacteriales bacterium]